MNESNILRFDTKDAAQSFIDETNMLGWPHLSFTSGIGSAWICVCSTKQGMAAAIGNGRAVILTDW